MQRIRTVHLLVAGAAVVAASCAAGCSQEAMSQGEGLGSPQPGGAGATPPSPMQTAPAVAGSAAPPEPMPERTPSAVPAVEPSGPVVTPEEPALPPPTPGQCRDMAQQAIESFYATHGERWELSVTATEYRERLLPQGGPCMGDGSVIRLVHDGSQAKFILHLGCTDLDSVSIKNLNRANPQLTLDRVPHGIDISPCPFRFSVDLPASTVADAVRFVEIEDGRVVLTMSTRIFRVSGFSLDEDACPYVADAPRPPHCYANVDQDMTLDATFELPFDIAATEALVNPSTP